MHLAIYYLARHLILYMYMYKGSYMYLFYLCIFICMYMGGWFVQAPWFNTWSGVIRHLRRICREQVGSIRHQE